MIQFVCNLTTSMVRFKTIKINVTKKSFTLNYLASYWVINITQKQS